LATPEGRRAGRADLERIRAAVPEALRPGGIDPRRRRDLVRGVELEDVVAIRLRLLAGRIPERIGPGVRIERPRKGKYLRLDLIAGLPELACATGHLPAVGQMTGEFPIERAILESCVTDVVVEQIGRLQALWIAAVARGDHIRE